MTNNIALCGLKGSGKTRASNLFEKAGYERVSFASPLKRILSETFPEIKDSFYKAGLKETNVDAFSSFEDVFIKRKLLIKNILKAMCISDWGSDVRMDVSCIDSPIPYLDGTTTGHVTSDVSGLFSEWVKMQMNNSLTPRIMMQTLGTDVMRRWNGNIHVMMFENETQGIDKFVCDDARFPNELECLKHKGCETVWLHRPSLGEQQDMHESETSIGQSDCFITIRSDEGELLDECVKHRIKFGEWSDKCIM